MQRRYISVDVETAGPNPSTYSLLAIGACLVADPSRSFYAEMAPVNHAAVPEAIAVSGLSLDRLRTEGEPAAIAMERFAAWVEDVAEGRRPVFVALNAPFDWMFVADYLMRYAGRNPFGHTAVDMKALYMGMAAVPWSETTLRHIAARYGLRAELPHHALEDAVTQAAVFRAMLEELDVSAERGPASSV